MNTVTGHWKTEPTTVLNVQSSDACNSDKTMTKGVLYRSWDSEVRKLLRRYNIPVGDYREINASVSF